MNTPKRKQKAAEDDNRGHNQQRINYKHDQNWNNNIISKKKLQLQDTDYHETQRRNGVTKETSRDANQERERNEADKQGEKKAASKTQQGRCNKIQATTQCKIETSRRG